MCNFYIMFYTPGTRTTHRTCFTSGPPNYYWDKAGDARKFKPDNVPKTASIEPETRKEYKITTRDPIVKQGGTIDDRLVDSVASMRKPSGDDRGFIDLLRRLDKAYREQYRDPGF